ncbi:hypothetical protein KY290_036356 [Solanum tuberosum]|uniref:Uncharacterized protein n=1 Tax=Solanum tuberosum TaxID=4113 RepID=A0ABQ7TSF3_SOLTU|nr:hypothetical protein KY289_035875 [Solanum tuberosum]KAH0639056.1 hypothetical protein KY285_035642 [Solanum tuberosum]KAH0737651.1 hypothetical protein KY290_036356 [Solanum tuberosum]
MGRMFGIAELHLRISGRPVTEDEMATLVEHEDESDDPGPGYYNTDAGNGDGDAT